MVFSHPLTDPFTVTTLRGGWQGRGCRTLTLSGTGECRLVPMPGLLLFQVLPLSKPQPCPCVTTKLPRGEWRWSLVFSSLECTQLGLSGLTSLLSSEGLLFFLSILKCRQSRKPREPYAGWNSRTHSCPQICTSYLTSIPVS